MQNCTRTISTTGMPPSAGWPFWAGRVLMLVRDWTARARQRRDLAALDDHALRDIGLSRADVRRELAKPFWHP
jgi:uncharacterized protein YjiS (DUF1127 family)